MARAGMALRRGQNQGNTDGGTDDVQRSIELLDRVLSEFDDVENANQVQNIQQITTSTSTPQLRNENNTPNSSTNTAAINSTPDDESPSLGHQSEDDGYMSMNGRKAKFNLGFKALAEIPVHHETIQQVQTVGNIIDINDYPPDDFPPPPEEAERLIATLLPNISPSHKPKSTSRNKGFQMSQLPVRMDTIPPPQKFQNIGDYNPIINGLPDPIHTATQTTLPKTRHQRPYGWENNDFTLSPPPPPPGYRFGSLPFQHGMYPLTSPTRGPQRISPSQRISQRSSMERRREVKRSCSEDLSSDTEDNVLRPLSELADDEHFSDDSLEEMLPPPPPNCNKRASIAWEVPLDDDPLLRPVIGRRRRKSGSCSSTSSIPNRLKELDDWPDPPPNCTTEDEVTSPFSDSDDHVILPPEVNSNLSGTSTYVIRKGKKDRKSLGNVAGSCTSNSSINSRLSSEFSIPASRYSTDLNSRLSRELNTPNSRYSVDLGTPHFRLSQELNSPKSRLSLDLTNARQLSQELSSSPSRLSIDLSSSRSSTPHSKHGENKKHSTTFDNIKSLIREGKIENYSSPNEEKVTELSPQITPIVRVVSLPSLNAEEFTPTRQLDTTVEEEEDTETSQQSAEISPLRKIEQNISELLERRDIEVVEGDKFILNGVENLSKDRKGKKKAPSKPVRESKIADRHKMHDLQKSSSNNEIQKTEDYYRQLLIEGGTPFPKRNGIQKSESAKEMLIAHRENRPLTTSTSADFPVRVEIHQHEFPPLPPSPVEEDEDEYSEILAPGQKVQSESLPKNHEAPLVPPHREPSSSSLKTRSMDANYNRGRRSNYYNSSNRNIPPERRTLPNDPQEKRRAYQKRSSHSPQEELHMQTSCSLPETPIFARGCDIPRTPHRRAPDIPGSQTAPRQSNTMGSLNTIGNLSTGGYRRGMSHSGLEQAMVGAELLRLAGGPGRGWYPKQRHRRPASIEHLDRLAPGQNPWESNRKPLTLPPNLTPKFFQRSPRDALRRVTSLLIRKGNNGKEPKKEKEIVSPTIHENANVSGEETQKKKGFFKNFWKRSRHYSLEQQ
ncbi:uncharacterized protein LOC109594264 isoform X2 [Aethina tumida]|uniref:uncharacterized protein LOC109594264 isoform X2 n=1 Tax=Aethina tumida TaxID=116153 RepID=UPI002148BCCB|nr:uncharacterized protein LOC109594264 isoform X2 [Aethina tumida]